MATRLEILKKSLEKKLSAFDEKINDHFKTVALANGQPLNDKKSGRRTLKKWSDQNDALKIMEESIEKTKIAIEKEEMKVRLVENCSEQLPKIILEMIEKKELIQWRKYPNTFFVPSVEKARIVYDFKKGVLTHKYSEYIKDKKELSTFKNIFDQLKKELDSM